MCTVSFVADHYREKWDKPPVSPFAPVVPIWESISRVEFEQLRREVEDMKALLKKAKIYDEENGEPDCEMEEKVAFLRKIAEAVGVDLDEVFGSDPTAKSST